MIDDDSTNQNALNRRMFYLHMSPFEGHEIANEHGGFDMPSKDVLENEIRNVLTSWLTIQQTSVGQIVADSAWWMLRVLDPDNSRNAEESMHILDRLTSFGMSILGQSLERGFIHLTEDTTLPDIVTSSDMLLSDDDFDLLRQLESLWEERNDDE